jgi:hypothetical protein
VLLQLSRIVRARPVRLRPLRRFGRRLRHELNHYTPVSLSRSRRAVSALLIEITTILTYPRAVGEARMLSALRKALSRRESHCERQSTEDNIDTVKTTTGGTSGAPVSCWRYRRYPENDRTRGAPVESYTLVRKTITIQTPVITATVERGQLSDESVEQRRSSHDRYLQRRGYG